jgi:hypothetical protein
MVNLSPLLPIRRASIRTPEVDVHVRKGNSTDKQLNEVIKKKAEITKLFFII